MKTLLKLLLLGLGLLIFIALLPSCLTSPPQSDPYSLQAQAENALNLAHAQMTATAQVEIIKAEQEILQQAQTQASDSQKATATALVFAGLQTQAAATLTQAVQETAQVIHGTETAVAIDKLFTGATATQAALETLQVVEATSTQHAADLAALSLARERAQLQREKLTRWVLWSVLILGMVLTLALGTYVIKALTQIHDRQKKWIPGAGTLVFETPGGPVILDPRRMFSAAAVITTKTQAVSAPEMAPDPLYQWVTTQAAQWVELARVTADGYHHSNSRSKNELPVKALPQLLNPSLALQNNLPPVAPWRMLDDWRGGGLPLGLGDKGLILAEPEHNPHLLIAGTSGSGKTRYGLRPVIAGALASGWQVVIFDRSGLDFLLFQNYPNAHLILLPDATQAIGYLATFFDEIHTRFVQLREAGVSTWSYLPNAGPRILAIFDEFSNLADALPNSEREELWRNARMVAAEGRKAGIHLALALQDPTHKSLDLRIRRNCTPLAFRVRDDAASRVVLGAGGADELPPHQFLTVIQARLYRGVAFSPSDEELVTFLDNHPVLPLPPLNWLKNREKPQQNESGAQGVDAILVERIRPFWHPDVSLSEIAQAVGMQPGGTHYYKLRAAINYLSREE